MIPKLQGSGAPQDIDDVDGVRQDDDASPESSAKELEVGQGDQFPEESVARANFGSRNAYDPRIHLRLPLRNAVIEQALGRRVLLEQSREAAEKAVQKAEQADERMQKMIESAAASGALHTLTQLQLGQRQFNADLEDFIWEGREYARRHRWPRR
jgi:hypothetical protein